MEESEAGLRDEEFDDSSDEETKDTVTKREPDELHPAPMKALRNVSAEELHNDDTELILFRVPRHTRLRGALEGSKFKISVADNVIDKKMAVYQGSYVVRDCGTKRCKQVRPVFVTEDKDGVSRMQVGKRFSRFLTVTFQMNISSLGDQKPKARVYPEKKTGLKLKYHPLGKVLPEEHSTEAKTLEVND